MAEIFEANLDLTLDIGTGPVFKKNIIMEKCHYLIKVIPCPCKVPFF